MRSPSPALRNVFAPTLAVEKRNEIARLTRSDTAGHRWLNAFTAEAHDRGMRSFKHLLLVGLASALLGAAGCAHSQSNHPSLGETSAIEAPPAPLDPYYTDKPGHVWVHGRWARNDGQWVWQEGYYEKERPGQVYCNGFWDRKDGSFVWVDGYWKEPRAGHVYVPGYWGYRGTTYVWIRERWEKERPGQVWVPGAWEDVDGEKAWNDGHWDSPDKTASR